MTWLNNYMQVHYHKNFWKSYRQRIVKNFKLEAKFKQRLKLFITDKSNPTLKDHPLVGSKTGYRAFSVTGDYRVIYEETDDGILLHNIGTHNQVYWYNLI